MNWMLLLLPSEQCVCIVLTCDYLTGLGNSHSRPSGTTSAITRQTLSVPESNASCEGWAWQVGIDDWWEADDRAYHFSV